MSAADAVDGEIDGLGALTEALAAQERVYGDMLRLTHEEETAILASDVEHLTEIVEQKQTLIEHLDALELERMTAVVAIAGALDLDPARITLSEIAVRLPREEALALTEAGVVLRGRAIALEQANERNALMLRRSRDLIDRWVQYLRLMIGGAIYGSSGQTREGGVGGGRSLDRTA